MIENATTGSQVITIKQGSGATINVPNGQVKMISTDGAGSGGAVLDLLVDVDLTGTTTAVNLDVSGTLGVTGVLTTTAATVSNGGGQFNGAINVGVDDTGYDVKFFGATTGKSLLWDESADSLIVTGTTTLVGTTNLDAVDIDGATQIDATVTVGVDDTGYDVKFFGATAGAYMLWDESADDLILGGAAGLSVNSTALVTGVLTTTAATVFNGGFASNANSTVGGTLSSGGIITTGNTSAAAASAGDGRLFPNNSYGAFVYGNGTIYDVALAQRSTGVALGVLAGTTNVVIPSGNVSIGTSSPASDTANERILQVNAPTTFSTLSLSTSRANVSGDNIGKLSFDVLNNTATYRSRAQITAQSAGSTANKYGADMMFFTASDNTTDAAERMRIDSSGNIIIANTGGTLYTTTAGTNNFRAGVNAGNSIASGGNYNVCIGDEAGTTLSTGDESVFVGYAAGDAISTGTQNVAIGSNALGTGITATNNTAVGRSSMAATLGSENTAVGVNTLSSNQGGSHSVAIGSAALTAQNPSSGNVDFYNVAVGSSAGTNLSTGTNNTFVGAKSAGSGVVTGTRNNSFGYQAGLALTSGTNNVFMGSYSGLAITTGVSNTVCGEAALITEDAGDKNTAIGAEALKAQNGGRDGNVAVGYYAGFALTEGENNTIIGTEAMSLSAITGDENVAVGYRAGKNLTTGSGNVLIGKFAGADTTLLTTGTQNIVIGPLARTSSASVNNEIVIGYFVAGSGEGTATIGNGNGKISVDFEADATWSHSSDERLKKDIVADDLGLSFINRLETVKYKWKPSNEIDESLPQYAEENTRKTNVVMHGMVAQTVKAALDAENVDTFAGWSEDLDGTQKISREMFVTPLIKAVQELSTALDAALARIAVLEG
jgi:trimeric autotransporter adhesin